MRIQRLLSIAVAATFSMVAYATIASATVCTVPDSSGTASLPPSCPSGYLGPSGEDMITNGLPPGQTIEVDAQLSSFTCPGVATVCSFAPPSPGVCHQAGGTLGGEQECSGSTLTMKMNGTGGLFYNRTINLSVEFETHSAPRTPGEPVQSFDTDMFRLFGQLPPGDPDFDLLRVTAGVDFGYPSPGHTTLLQVPGGWQVDSFFDVTYRVDFVGHIPGPLAGMSGSSLSTFRMQAGETIVFDHLECFKPKDTVKLKALADVLAPGLYASSGCKLGNATNYCRPAIKQVTVSNVPVIPVPGQNLTNPFVCYKMKCPKVVITQAVTDQFGSRTLTKLKHQQLCVPAP